MSQSLHFYTEGRIVTFTYSKKKSSSNDYVPGNISILVGPANNDHSTYQTELNEDYVFTHFTSLPTFFNFLKSKKDQAEVLRLINSQILAVMIRDQEGNVEEQQLIDLSKVQIVDQRELQSVSHRVDFYNSFKSRIIQKIQKIVKKHYRTKKQEKQYSIRKQEQNNNCIKATKKKEEKKIKLINPHSQVIFTISPEGYQREYILNQHITEHQFIVPVTQLQLQQFRIKINSLKYDKIIISVECLRREEDNQAGALRTCSVRRTCQFGKSMLSWFRVEEGEEIQVGVQVGEVFIRNRDSNMGKMFDNLIQGSDQEWDCKIWVSLQEVISNLL